MVSGVRGREGSGEWGEGQREEVSGARSTEGSGEWGEGQRGKW